MIIKILELLLLLLLFLFPLALVISITLVGVLIYAGATAFLLLIILNPKNFFQNFKTDYIDSAFLIYIAAFTVSKFINSGVDDAVNAFCRTSQDFFVFIWASYVVSRSSKNKNLISNALLFAALITVLYGVFQYFHFDPFGRQSNPDRLSGFHKNPYTYAGQLIVFFFYLLNYVKEKNSLLLMIPLLMMSVFCIVNTAQRAVMIGVLIGFVVYLAIIKFKIADLAKLVALVSLPVVFTVCLSKKILLRIKKTIFQGFLLGKNPRFKLWGIGFSVWKRNLLFGAGKFPPVYHELAGKNTYQLLTHAHNVYLQILVVNGIVGLVAFINLFLSIFQRLVADLKINKYAPNLMCIIIAFLIEGIFEYFWGDSEVRYLLLFFTGYVLAYIRQKDDFCNN